MDPAEGERKGLLAARNFQSVFLPQAKQELGGQAWKKGLEQYVRKTEGAPPHRRGRPWPAAS